MPNHTTAATVEIRTGSHAELTCADVEALLAESEAVNAHLRAENADLHRRLDLAVNSKQQAIDEAVMLRSRPSN